MITKTLNMVLIGILCVVCSASDIKSGVVKNKSLYTIGLPAVILNLTTFFKDDVLSLVIAMSICVPFIVATFLYGLKIWAGGDYKLFLVILFSMPYKMLTREFVGIPLGLRMIGCSFILGYIFLILESIAKSFKNLEKKTQRNFIVKKTLTDFVQYIPLYFFINLNQFFLYVIEEQLFGEADTNITFCVNALIVFLVNKVNIFQDKIVAIVVLFMNLFLWSIGILNLFSETTILMWILILLTYLLKNFVNQFNYHEIMNNELKAGMILSVETSYMFANASKCKFNKISKENLESRLKKEDVIAIQDFCNRIEKNVRLIIVRKVPFAFFISVSTIIVFIWELLCL